MGFLTLGLGAGVVNARLDRAMQALVLLTLNRGAGGWEQSSDERGKGARGEGLVDERSGDGRAADLGGGIPF